MDPPRPGRARPVNWSGRLALVAPVHCGGDQSSGLPRRLSSRNLAGARGLPSAHRIDRRLVLHRIRNAEQNVGPSGYCRDRTTNRLGVSV